jgi:virulence factor Mce-like protein
MVLFALSCFGLLLFLWLSFGGPLPLKPKGYRVQVGIPEAAQLGLEADVRVAGVRVGKVRAKKLDPEGNRTLATLEIDRRFAPIHKDVKVILRQKTLLGETYVEMTPGTKHSGYVKEDGRLPDARVVPSVQLDEIFTAFDPKTRDAFKIWQRSLAESIANRGRDFNDALGNLDDFASSATDTLQVLDSNERDLRRVVRDTGVVFEALTQDESSLHNLVTGSANTFRATGAQNDKLAEAFRIFPTFLDESKATLKRLQRFAVDTAPLMTDLKPAAHDLAPALRDVKLLAPDLQRTFKDLDPLITVSKKGLPAVRDILKAVSPNLSATGGFLKELNPILQYLELYQLQVADFFTNGGSATADTTNTQTDGATGHYLRQFGPLGPESVSVFPIRYPNNRGNTYLPPDGLFGREFQLREMTPTWDCANDGGEHPKRTGIGTTGQGGSPACWIAKPFTFQGEQQGQFPHVDAADYSK